jgi:alkylhydroperoxidase family enzyme
VVLGRSTGIPDQKLAHVGDDPPPAGVYEPAEEAVIRYAQASTRLEPITDDLYQSLAAHFDQQQIIEICLTVGLSNLVNRFHATFLTDVDAATTAALDEPEGGPTHP